MATEKQMQANRQNGLLGGVKTEEGKNISRMNAIKHGFFNRIITEEDKLSNWEFYFEIYDYFDPANIYEMQLIEIILSNLLAYRRICVIETYLLANEFERGKHAFSLEAMRYPNKNISLSDELLKFQRYKTSALNSITKAQHELERLIRTRNGEAVSPPSICDLNISTQ